MKKNKNNGKGLDPCFFSFFVPLVLMCVCIFSVSCKLTAEGVVSAADDDVKNPVLAEFFQGSADSLTLTFTETVELSDLEVRTGADQGLGELVFAADLLDVQSDDMDENPTAEMTAGEQPPESGKFLVNVSFRKDEELLPGEAYFLSGIAQDGEGNSLLFRVPFHGFNSNVAGLVLSEVRTEASSASKDNAKIEFIELYVHSPGSLAGISLVNGNDDAKYGEYVFPDAEVNAGDYIVVHFRTMEEHAAGCIDETGADLNESTAPDSCAGARDFWVPGTSARLGKSDVILLRERSGGKLMDALLYAQPDISASALKKLESFARQAVEEGAWQGTAEVSTWASGEGVTTTRTLSRQNIADVDLAAVLSVPVAAAENWFVVASSNATPGQPNSTNKYVAK